MIPVYYCTAESTQGNIFSNFSIDDTQLIQPSITLTVNSSRIDDQRLHNTGWSGYVVGYKDCTSNPGDLCYIPFQRLPYGYQNDYVHIVNPDSESESPRVSVGDECSFFGCFVYKEESEYDKLCIKEVRGTILEQNVTICKCLSFYYGLSLVSGTKRNMLLANYAPFQWQHVILNTVLRMEVLGLRFH
jgi:hypothetical protein